MADPEGHAPLPGPISCILMHFSSKILLDSNFSFKLKPPPHLRNSGSATVRPNKTLYTYVAILFCFKFHYFSPAQVMYVTATSPYLLMTILLINGATLPGAAQGVKFYLIPDFEKIKDIQVRL